MPCIKMRTDTAEPRRLSGKLYVVTQAEGWELVRIGAASWKYLPVGKESALTNFEIDEKPEPKRYPVKPRTQKETA